MPNERELELKLEVEAGAATIAALPLLEGTAAEAKPQTTVYFDTPGGTVTKAGFSLRVRSVDGGFVQTVKQADGLAAGLFDRPEWETPVTGCEIDIGALDATPLGALLKDKARDKLTPVVTSEVVRTIWNLEQDGAEIEINVDEGTIRGGEREEPLRELEIELKRGAPPVLMAVAREIGRSLPVRLGAMTKAERGFAIADGTIDEVRKADPVRISQGDSVAQAFAAIVNACLRHFRLNEPLVATRRDASALHQARVAMRRLRSALSLFGRAVEDDEFSRIREELRWFTGQLGEARNLDVLLKRFGDEADEGSLKALRTARERAYDRVLAALDAQRFRDLVLDLVGWVEFGDWREGKRAGKPIEDFAEGRLDRRWKTVKKTGRQLAGLDEEPRHRLRIDIKKLRYALEFLSGLYEERSRERKNFLAAMADIQEELGFLNDLATARAMLGGIPGVNPSLIPQADADEEPRHIAAAQEAYEALTAIGPFWR